MTIRMQKLHKPTGFGKGKWQSNATFWRYKLKRRKLNKLASKARAVTRSRA